MRDVYAICEYVMILDYPYDNTYSINLRSNKQCKRINYHTFRVVKIVKMVTLY